MPNEPSIHKRQKTRRLCLGPGEGHYFLSEGPWNRLCVDCNRRNAGLAVSPTMTHPVQSQWRDEPVQSRT